MVYNVGHDSLVLCPLLNIFTFYIFILNYITISLIFATPPVYDLFLLILYHGSFPFLFILA
jgi:hypothetical protein